MDINKLPKKDLIALIQEITNNTNKAKDEIGLHETVLVQSNMLYKIGFTLNQGEEIIIEKNSVHSLTLDDCNAILRKPAQKQLFRSGLLYFKDDKWYKHFGIIKPKIVNDSYIIDILSNENTVLNNLNILTQRKSDMTMMNHLSFKIAELARKRPELVSFELLPKLNDYFSTKYMKVDLTRLLFIQY